MNGVSIFFLWKARRHVRSLYRKERKSPFALPFSKKIAMWRRGFLSESALTYAAAHDQLDNYLSDFARYARTPYINGDHSSFLDNKILFEKFFGALVDIPKNLGMIHKGHFMPLVNDTTAQTVGSLLDYAEHTTGLVFKPFDGGLGAEVVILLHDKERGFLVNGRVMTREEVGSLLSGFRLMLVCEYVTQAGYARRIFSKTTNTIRVLTMIDPDTGKAFIARASHRFGSARTGAVDNWAQGALSVNVALDTGELGQGVYITPSGSLAYHDSHPDTGEAIKGIRVPGWEALCEKLLVVANAYSFIPYVGWDVVVTDDGFKVLEGNSFTGVTLFQVHGPLLSDSRVRRFYEYHDVV